MLGGEQDMYPIPASTDRMVKQYIKMAKEHMQKVVVLHQAWGARSPSSRLWGIHLQHDGLDTR